MDSKFEVYYFPIKGRGEFVRLVLAAAKANWENKLINDWAKEKFSTEGLLYKQVPMLIEHKADGKELRLVETSAIIRYIANTFNLAAECPCKNALLDSYFTGLYDVADKIIMAAFKAKVSEPVEKTILNNEAIKNSIQYQEEILANNGSNGHYMDDKLTYVDIVAYRLVENYINFPPLKGFFSNETTPNLMKVYETVSKNPEIIEYLKSEKRFAN
ncbi:hypothetical protein BCR36DRAFT_285867 [Piromyces finnis]|uniref:Glutathione S-transferase n=1 Tax=Piromyces finnis TaxID=1754191 RepID=A0A1Y1VD37_9FUNG|nr:hypothetical protein BCR36DRAFT_285867 [Piromyces finnis]|eukprot:ORX53000.1 hypothetical protein BCR36DRAFT_285867 [Piromyces finnis]